MAGLGPLAAGLGQILTRTIFLQTITPSGIPIPLAVLDVVSDEKPNFRATVTEHPVEQGTEITDHIQLQNPTLTLKGKFSSTPLDIAVAVANALSGGYLAATSSQFRSNILNTGLSQASGILGASLQGNSFNLQSSVQAGAIDAIVRSILLTVYENKTRFNVITKRQTFTNMVIESMSFPRNGETGYALDFEINLKQVRIVSPLVSTINQLDESVIPTASSSTNLGTQTTSQISPQLQNQMASSPINQTPGMSGQIPGTANV